MSWRILLRWSKFQAVGAAGVGVQLTLLALLLYRLDCHYLPATGLAVEGALLHNFFWHSGWTWRDRPPSGFRELGRRLLQFHLTSGVTSLGGNLLAMYWMVERLELFPLLSNLLAIGLCSLVNFCLAETLVFANREPFLPGIRNFIKNRGSSTCLRGRNPWLERGGTDTDSVPVGGGRRSMTMFEILSIVAVLTLIGVVLLVFSVLAGLILIPVKIAVTAVKVAFWVVIGIPLAILLSLLAVAVLPVALLFGLLVLVVAIPAGLIFVLVGA